MKKEPSGRINEFIRVLLKTKRKRGKRKFWPVSPLKVSYKFPYLDIEAKYLYRNLKKLRRKKVKTKKIASYMPSPTNLRAYLPELVIASKLAFLSPKQRVWLLKQFFKFLEEKQRGNIFCAEGKNLVLTQREVRDCLNKKTFEKISKQEIKQGISKLIGALESLTWTLFYDAHHTIGIESHGPYDSSFKFPNTSLIIKEYRNLSPTSIWEKTKKIGFEKATFYLFYKDVSYSIGYYGNMYSSSPNLPSKLIFARIELDGKEFTHLNSEKIGEIIQRVNDYVKNQHQLVNSLSYKEKVKKFLKIRYFMFKDFREWLGDDWHPPEEIWERKQKAPRLLYDPRENFVM